MRPELLEIEGFSAFRERTEVCFGGTDLFAFWGPTGAGKSSLIDAIVFALYGSVPRYQNKNLVAPLISQGANEARVRLRFSLAGQRYTAARVVRADGKGGASTREARLERDGPTAEEPGEVLAGDADGVTAAVEALLGLSYEHFTTCVVLPQGDFARFLHHRPADRQGLLIRLLDLGVYSRMARLAGERSAVARARRELVAARLDELADRTPERRAALVERREVTDRLVAAIDAARPELDRLTDEVAAANQRMAEADRWISLLIAVEPPPGLDELAGAVGRADDEVAEADTSLAAADVVLAAADAHLAAQSPAEELAALVARWAEHAEQARLAERGRRALDVADGALREAAARAVAALANRTDVEAAVEAARRENLAADLADGLKPGDPCPVCAQPVGTLPEHHGGDLPAARRRLDAATKAQLAAEDDRRRTATEHARVEEKLAGVEARLAELDDALGCGPDAPTAAKALDAARAAAEARARAASVRSDAEAAARAARARRAGLDGAVAGAWAALDDHRDRLGGLVPPRPGRVDVQADWALLTDWARQQHARHRASSDAARACSEAAGAQLGQLVAQLEAAAAALGLRGDGRRPVRDVVVEGRATAEAALAAFDRDVESAAALRAEFDQALEGEQVAGALAGHLRSTGFQKWLLDEALDRLVAGASGILHQLSNGAYTLALDRRSSGFAVIDHHNADAVRSVRTLSGGETFLASLALALALADQVVDLAAGGSARLESIFLDEGFGTLDPETLDVVAAAIEELGSQGRVVGLVSHVRDLAERLPVRFEVRKGPTTATVTRVEG